MNLVDILILILGEHPIWISFFGGIFGGEATIITLSFLSVQGYLPLWTIIIFSTLGLIISDFVLFMVGRFHFIKNIKQLEKHSKTFKKIDKIIIKWGGNNTFMVLLYTKFIYGTSIPTLIYLGMKNTPYHKFLIYNIIVNLVFMSIFMGFGILGGNSFTYLYELFNDVRFAIFGLIVFIVFFILIKKWISTKLIRKR